ncbi:MAG: YfiT family bacillithiol transferase [Bryobacteraceae bacterium]
MDDLRYPVGKFTYTGPASDADLQLWLSQIAATPALLRAAVGGLSEEQLNTPYRPEGWTVRQVVHHVPDSHMNSYVRFRLALTEEHPLIKPYHENLWAELPDASSAPVDLSLNLLDSLHQRWMLLLNSLRPADLAKAFRHPEMGLVTLEKNVALYAWHGRHHVAHITSLKSRMGWS